jgi:CheY-like chemotaxis protein
MDTNARILVIEDNEDVRENLVEILELSGFDVNEAPNGLAGVKIALQSPPDLILCDVMMPELDGYGVLELLNQRAETAGVPFIFITARTEKDDLRRGMNLGADDYITKPFYKDELLSVIRLRLRKAEARSQSSPNGTTQVAAVERLDNPERGRSELEKAFQEKGKEKVYEQGAAIVREDEHPFFIYQVQQGRVHLVKAHEYGRDYIMAEIGPGEIFGLPAALEDKPFNYTARVGGEACVCHLLSKTDLASLLRSDHNVTTAIMHLMAEQVVVQGEKLVHQAYDSVRRRTALILCHLDEKYDGSIELSREELAQMVGTTKESVIRALSDFKKDKLIASSGRKIDVLDAQQLFGLLV